MAKKDCKGRIRYKTFIIMIKEKKIIFPPNNYIIRYKAVNKMCQLGLKKLVLKKNNYQV